MVVNRVGERRSLVEGITQRQVQWVGAILRHGLLVDDSRWLCGRPNVKGKKENTLLVLYDLIGDRSCEGLKRVEDGSVAALFGHQQEHQLSLIHI